MVETLIRDVRLVPVAGVPAPPGLVDVRIRGGAVSEVAPGLAADGAAERFDGGGRWAVPGLWDQHVHLEQWGRTATRLELAGTTGPADALARVAAHLAAEPAGATAAVQGWGHRSAAWSRQPTVAELDAVTGARPVVLISGDGHNGWLNSAALRALGVPPRSGALDENDWFPLYARLAELPGGAGQVERGVAEAARQAAALGVVGVVDLEFTDAFRAWPARLGAGVNQLRVRAATYPHQLDEVLSAGLRTGDRLAPGPDGGLVTMGPLKIISDGSLNTRTAYCREPYADAAELEHPRGKQNNSPAELVDLLGRARDGGLQVALHAIGDAAVADALDAFERTGARGSIEHAQLMRPGDVIRMGRLGVRAGVQPAHLLDDRDVTMRCWPDRAGRCFPLRSMLDAGVQLVLGSDAPVSPLDPWLAMAAAVHRSADEREPWHPEQAITAAEALAASTDGQATLRPGSRGDVVLLDDDPLAAARDSAAAAARLRTMAVAATFVAGRPTHLEL
jgi:predicted amidohydrolase YtcJ